MACCLIKTFTEENKQPAAMKPDALGPPEHPAKTEKGRLLQIVEREIPVNSFQAY